MKRTILILPILLLSGQILFAQAPDSEIFVFSIDKRDGKYVFADGRNITNNPGYDNQPSFSLDNKSVLFTSFRNGKDFNIYEYDLADGKIAPVTTSGENDYSARELDENTIAFVREGPEQVMTVMKFDRKTKSETPVLKNREPVAYYAFNSKGDALVWIRYAYMMHHVNPEKNVNRFVTDYAQPSAPHLIPGTDRFSFMKRLPNDELWIMEFDPATSAVRPLASAKDGKLNYSWLADGSILLGSGGKLFRFDERTEKGWTEIADLASSGIRDITRLAVSPDGKYLAVVENR